MSNNPASQKPFQPTNVRIPREMLERARSLENARAACEGRRASLHAWILEAIREKIERERHE